LVASLGNKNAQLTEAEFDDAIYEAMYDDEMYDDDDHHICNKEEGGGGEEKIKAKY
jgi:hypothetical protein